MRLITWNIQRGRTLDGRCDLEAVVRTLSGLGEAEVLCLQEVSSGHDDLPGLRGENQFLTLTRLLPGWTPVAGVCADTGGAGPRRRFGSMIFSRHPVLQATRHALPWPADPGVMSMQRGMLEVTLATPLGLLRVATTHLEYFSLVQRLAQVERLRQLQQEAHARHPGAASPSNGPFRAPPRPAAAILAGDFNFLPMSPEYQRLCQPFEDGTPAWRDAWTQAHGHCARAPGFDFVFICPTLAERVAGVRAAAHTLGSDHQPLLLDLERTLAFSSALES